MVGAGGVVVVRLVVGGLVVVGSTVIAVGKGDEKQLRSSSNCSYNSQLVSGCDQLTSGICR